MIKQLIAGALMVSCISSGEIVANDNKLAASLQYEWDAAQAAEVTKVIPIQKVTEEMISNVMKGESTDVAVECTAGVSIPLNLFLKGNLISLEAMKDSHYSVRILKTFYLRHDGKEVVFSHDLNQWKSVLDFTTGSTGISLNIVEGQLTLGCGAELNIR